jgi:hypothetical protein
VASRSIVSAALGQIEPIARRVARSLGWHLVRADYYSPIVDADRLPESTFTRQSPLPGLELGLSAQLDLLENSLSAYLAEWSPPLHPPGDERGFHLVNGFYGPLDANVLYAVLRQRRPRRVVELGSGFSTLTIRSAAIRNAREGAPLVHTVVDPFPSPLISGLQGIDRRHLTVTDAGLAELAELERGDLLFVDTTHVVKPANDVVHLVLEALPALANGVLVHFHDIFRPFEYPRALYEEFNKHWQEQYLLQAFLAYNPEFRVLLANHALARTNLERLRRLVPALTAEMAPSGFWIEKIGADRA